MLTVINRYALVDGDPTIEEIHWKIIPVDEDGNPLLERASAVQVTLPTQEEDINGDRGGIQVLAVAVSCAQPLAGEVGENYYDVPVPEKTELVKKDAYDAVVASRRAYEMSARESLRRENEEYMQAHAQVEVEEWLGQPQLSQEELGLLRVLIQGTEKES